MFLRVSRALEERNVFIREGGVVVLEQQLLGPISWDFARDEDQVMRMPGVNKVAPASARREVQAHFSTLYLVRLELYSLLQGS